MEKTILDMCCGSRMFYFDKHDPNVLFTDIREYHDTLCDGRKLDVQPDMIADCTALPFEDETFNMVVFDPPHLQKVGQNSWLCKKYGKLPENWQAFINDSIHEGMRVLKTGGTLIFKWNEQQIKVGEVLKAIKDYKPIFGHRITIKSQTIWMTFMKYRWSLKKNINKEKNNYYANRFTFSLLFLMIKLEEAKGDQMADKNFVAALTEVLRYFRDNGELKKAYELQKDSLADIANSPWAKLVIGMLTSKMQEDKVDAELPNIDALIEENTSDDFIEKKINDVLGDDVELKEE